MEFRGNDRQAVIGFGDGAAEFVDLVGEGGETVCLVPAQVRDSS